MRDHPYPLPSVPPDFVAELGVEPERSSGGHHLLELAEILGRAERDSRAAAGSLIEAMLPRSEVPSPVAVLQARRNAEAREALIREFGALSSSEVAQLASSRAKNRAALAHRWKQEGRIFSAPYHGTEVFPGFQFDDQGQPRETIREVIALFSGRSPWELALWFIVANGWLAGRRPVDLLDTDPEAATAAARRSAAGIVF